MNKMILSISIVGALLFAMSFSTTRQSVAMENAASFIKENCTACHGLARCCTNLGKDKVWWNATLERMIMRGVKLEESQAISLGDLLADPDVDIKTMCKK